ncbi:MAG TPA: hypothetical protein VGF95_16555 [Solirubrobacteraceae bacterium]
MPGTRRVDERGDGISRVPLGVCGAVGGISLVPPGVCGGVGAIVSARLRRIRLGELLATLGAACVIVALILPWYGGAVGAAGADASGRLGAWSTFGPTIVFLLIAAAGGLFLLLANVFERTTAVPVASAIWSTLFGFVASICAIVRLCERPHGASGLLVGAWLAFAGALLILGGSWQSLRDERPELYGPTNVPVRKL